MKPILKNHIVLTQIKSIHEFFALLEYGMKPENKNSSSVYHSGFCKVKPYAFFNHWSIAKINNAINAGRFWAVRKKTNADRFGLSLQEADEAFKTFGKQLNNIKN